MKKERLLWAAIIGLLMLNLATLGYVLLRPAGHPPHGGGPGQYIVRRLHLSPRQQEQFAQMREQHHAEMERLTGEYQALLQPYLSLLESPSPDSTLKTRLETQMAGFERQKLQVTFAHFAELKAICTPEQQALFPEMIPRLTEVLIGPPRAGHPHSPRD